MLFSLNRTWLLVHRYTEKKWQESSSWKWKSWAKNVFRIFGLILHAKKSVQKKEREKGLEWKAGPPRMTKEADQIKCNQGFPIKARDTKSWKSAILKGILAPQSFLNVYLNDMRRSPLLWFVLCWKKIYLMSAFVKFSTFLKTSSK